MLSANKFEFDENLRASNMDEEVHWQCSVASWSDVIGVYNFMQHETWKGVVVENNRLSVCLLWFK